MKIRTINHLQEFIDKELAWRKKELSTLKLNVQKAKSKLLDTALRSAITLLYAHWEGGVKNIAVAYLDYVHSKKIPYKDLSHNFLAIKLKNDLESFSGANKTTKHLEIIANLFRQLEEKCKLPSGEIIKTKSNLNSEILVEILATMGLESTFYETSFNLIDETLLNMRNQVAHGERLDTISLDINRYTELHSRIINLLDFFSVQVINAAATELYKTNT